MIIKVFPAVGEVVDSSVFHVRLGDKLEGQARVEIVFDANKPVGKIKLYRALKPKDEEDRIVCDEEGRPLICMKEYTFRRWALQQHGKISFVDCERVL